MLHPLGKGELEPRHVEHERDRIGAEHHPPQAPRLWAALIQNRAWLPSPLFSAFRHDDTSERKMSYFTAW